MKTIFNDSGLVVQIEGADETVAGLERMGDLAKRIFVEALSLASESVRDIMKTEAPRATGELADTIDYEVDEARLQSSIGPSDAHYGRPVSRAIEFGRPAGAKAPPASELMRRYPYLSLPQAIAAAKTISERGIQANPFVFRTYMQTREILHNFGFQAAYNIRMSFYK